jgi:hypothetical protein
MEQLIDLFKSLGSVGLVGAIGLLIAGIKAYKKVMNGIEESKQAAFAIGRVNAVFQKAWKDKKISDHEIEKIQDSIEDAGKETKEAIEAWEGAGREIQDLIDKAKKKRHS